MGDSTSTYQCTPLHEMTVQVNATYLQKEPRLHYLRQVFDMAKEGGDDWVEDRFYKGKKIEQVGQVE